MDTIWLLYMDQQPQMGKVLKFEARARPPQNAGRDSGQTRDPEKNDVGNLYEFSRIEAEKRRADLQREGFYLQKRQLALVRKGILTAQKETGRVLQRATIENCREGLVDVSDADLYRIINGASLNDVVLRPVRYQACLEVLAERGILQAR